MGAPMAGHLVAAGHELFINTRSKVPDELAKTTAVICATPAEVATKADIIFMMVPDTPDVEKVLFGESGIASGLSKGKIVVDMSSISPIATKDFAKRINDLGCEYLDAPVMRCASLDTPIPFNTVLEKQYLANSRLDETMQKLLAF